MVCVSHGPTASRFTLITPALSPPFSTARYFPFEPRSAIFMTWLPRGTAATRGPGDRSNQVTILGSSNDFDRRQTHDALVHRMKQACERVDAHLVGTIGQPAIRNSRCYNPPLPEYTCEPKSLHS